MRLMRTPTTPLALCGWLHTGCNYLPSASGNTMSIHTRIFDSRNTANTRIRIAQCGKTSAVKYPMYSEGDRCGIAAFADMFSLSLQKHFR